MKGWPNFLDNIRKGKWQEELKYWGLPEELLEPCCLLNYFPNTASARQEKEEESQLEKSQVNLFSSKHFCVNK